MDTRAVVMRADDDRREPLERIGWTIAARSWGAQLDAARINRGVLQQHLGSLTASAEVRELAPADAARVLALDAATAEDYPGGVATRHEALTAERALPTPARRGFGAIDESGVLVAMTWVDIDGDSAETDFTVVQASHRGHGYGTAVKAASLLALLDAGVTRFRTGGSSENAAIIATNSSLGYVFDEEWITLSPSRQD